MANQEVNITKQADLTAIGGMMPATGESTTSESQTAMLAQLNELYGTVSEDASVTLSAVADLGMTEQKSEQLEYLKAAAQRIVSEEMAAADIDIKQAMMSISVDLQTLLTNIYEAQMEQGDTYNEVLLSQSERTEDTMGVKLDEMLDLIDTQKSAGEKPWWTYLVAAVVAVVGAVIAFFTAGAASALVGLLIAAIMMSPVGDQLTESIAKGIGGDNPDTGANIAATAIVAAICTVISMGAAGFTAGASNAVSGVASEGGKAIAKGASSAATKAVTTAVDIADDAGNAVAGALDDVVDDVASGAAKTATKAASKVAGKIQWDSKAFTTGLGQRFVGEYTAGFVGSGGLIQTVQAIMESTPEGEEFLNSEEGAITMAVVGILVSIGAGAAAMKSTQSGINTRMDYLKTNGLTDTLANISGKTLKALQVVRGVATSASGVEGVVRFANSLKIADIQEALAEVTAENTAETMGQNATYTAQSRANKSFASQTKTVSDSLRVAQDAFGMSEDAFTQNLAG